MAAEFHPFVDFLNKLEAAHIHYTLCKMNHRWIYYSATSETPNSGGHHLL